MKYYMDRVVETLESDSRTQVQRLLPGYEVPVDALRVFWSVYRKEHDGTVRCLADFNDSRECSVIVKELNTLERRLQSTEEDRDYFKHKYHAAKESKNGMAEEV